MYSLSYPIGTVEYNGTFVMRLSDERFLPDCRILKELDVNELMLSGYVTIEDADFDMMEETKRLGGLFDAMGMRPAQHHGLSATYAPLSQSQEPVIERLIRAVRYTANLNSPVLVIHADYYHEPEMWQKKFTTIEMFERECAAHGSGAVVETVAKNLREAGMEAMKLGVKIAVENCDCFFPMGGIEFLPDLIAKADSPAVGFCLDSGHAHCCGLTSVTEWIKVLGDKLFTTHFHDNRGPRKQALSEDKWISPSGIDEHMPPGFGTIPWIDVVQALWNAGYDNTVNFESGGWSGMDTKKGFQSAVEYWRTIELLAKQKLK